MHIQKSWMLVLVLLACSHTTEKKLNEKMEAQPAIESSNELNRETIITLKSAPNLSSDQKRKLTELQQKNEEQMSALRDQALKLRLLLVKDIANQQYNSSEVSAIKKRIKKVENQKLSILFDTVDKANQILGRGLPNRAVATREFLTSGKWIE
jgi:hypothetical protein